MSQLGQLGASRVGLQYHNWGNWGLQGAQSKGFQYHNWGNWGLQMSQPGKKSYCRAPHKALKIAVVFSGSQGVVLSFKGHGYQGSGFCFVVVSDDSGSVCRIRGRCSLCDILIRPVGISTEETLRPHRVSLGSRHLARMRMSLVAQNL